MKGAATRIKILKELVAPRDRFQLSRELGLDWSTVDYHIHVMRKHGLVAEKTAYGSVKMYELTETGLAVLRTLEQMNNGKDARPLKED